MKHVRILGALLAFVFAFCALPEIAAARTARHSVSSSHHSQARRGKRHKKRARRHHRKHASKSSNGLEF
jgi:hypothetical protein